MAGVFHHYRVSQLGQELDESLDEFVESGVFSEEQKKAILEHFDHAIATALSSWVRTKATVKGPLHHYRNHDDIWTFFLDKIEFKLDGSTIANSERTKIVSVSKR